VHDRLDESISLGKSKVVFTVETRTSEHLAHMLADIKAKGFEARVRNRGTD